MWSSNVKEERGRRKKTERIKQKKWKGEEGKMKNIDAFLLQSHTIICVRGVLYINAPKQRNRWTNKSHIYQATGENNM